MVIIRKISSAASLRTFYLTRSPGMTYNVATQGGGIWYVWDDGRTMNSATYGDGKVAF